MATIIQGNALVSATRVSAASALDCVRAAAVGAVASSAPTLLPAPNSFDLSDGSMASLAMLLTKSDEQDRAQARRVESAADQAANRDDNARVQQMQDKVGADWGQALVTGLSQIAGGACGIVSGAFAPPGPVAVSGGSVSFNWYTALQGASQVSGGFGTVFSAPFKADAQQHDAAAAKAEAQSQAEIRQYGQAHEDAQAANASIEKVAQFLEQAQQTQNATQLTAATFRA